MFEVLYQVSRDAHIFIFTVPTRSSLLSPHVHLYCPHMFIFTVPTRSSLLSPHVHLYCPHTFIFTVLTPSSLLSPHVHLYCPHMFIFTVLTRSSLLSSHLHLYCPQDVDQESGEDLNPQHTRSIVGGEVKGEEDNARNPDRPSSLPLVNAPEVDDQGEVRTFKRISSPERWELKQMIAAKAIDISELPDFDEETGLLPKQDDSGE